MAKKKYKIGSEEGANFYYQQLVEPKAVEVGDEVSLELEGAEQERALIAAGWLEPVTEKKGKEE